MTQDTPPENEPPPEDFNTWWIWIPMLLMFGISCAWMLYYIVTRTS